MTVLGMKDTRSITLDEMLVFCKAVSRAASRALVIGDMPFMSYHVSVEQAVRNAGRMVKEGGVDAVKLEGGGEIADVVRAITRAGIAVMGHIGVKPQSDVTLTGYRLKGKNAGEGYEMLEDARVLMEAGVFAIVVEHTSSEVTKLIAEELEIPVIGIGSGPYCDGQVLVFHDIVGLYDKSPPFSKKYVDLASVILDALQRYRDDVISGRFPAEEHTRHMKEEEYRRLLEMKKVSSRP